MNGTNTTTPTNGFGHLPGELDIFDDVGEELFVIYSVYNLVIDCVFILPTLTGNILILAALGRFSGLRKSTSSVLIGNLAVSDLLVGTFVFPLDILIRIRRDLFRVKLCLLFYSLVLTCIGASVLNLFLLSFERFHAITHPLKHAMVFTKRRIYISIGIIWIVIVGVSFMPLFGWHEAIPENDFKCGSGSLLSATYTTIICSAIVVSMTANGIFFVIIVRVATKAASAITYQNRTIEERERLKKNIVHTRMMLIVSGLFIVFWGPFCIISLVPNLSSTVKLVRHWLFTFGLFNSAINWMVYGWRSKKFRRAFRELLVCKCANEKVEISSM